MLRGRLRKYPAKLHGALRELNEERPALAAQPVTPEQAFYAAAEAAFDGAILRYSRRLELLTLADALDIPPVRASLIIASVQHRRGNALGSRPARGWFVPIFIGVLLQAAILISAALLLRA
jgi:hypothetical protein